MDVVLMIVCGTLMLSFLVLIHEGGHYLAARAFGVRVTELMLGMPGPNIGFKRGATKFGVTPILLGGYAKVCGMEPGEMSPHLEPVLASVYRRGTAHIEDVASDCGISVDEAEAALEELVEWGSVIEPQKKDQFNTYRTPEYRPTKRDFKRAAKAVAGMTASASATATANGAGGPSAADSAAAPEGALGSDPASGPSAAAAAVAAPAAPRAFALGEPREVLDAHALFESEYRQQYRSLPFWKRSVILVAGVTVNLLFAIVAFVIIYSIIGIDYQNTQTGEVTHFNANPLQAIQAGFVYIGMVIQAVAGLFNPATAAQTVSQSSSIVGIVVMSKDAFAMGFTNALFFTAAISVSLGIMNLIPIPPLDGGRFAIEVFQRISRRTVSARALNALSMAGMALFLGFFVFMVNQDVQRLIAGTFFGQ